MKKIFPAIHFLFCSLFLLTLLCCNRKGKTPSGETINAINLNRGELILCGPPDKQLGTVAFETSCSGKVKKDIDLAIALLHSFEYDEAEKVFAKIIDEEPECAMAYWGVAMSNYHPLWAPPSQPELEKGAKAIAIGQSLPQKSQRESDYIEAIALFYKDWNKTDHPDRCNNFEKAMEKIYKQYPNDKEAAIFYTLALIGTADPADKSYIKQRKAGAILTDLSDNEPNHPGIIHYIIHSYDYPELAAMALPAAKKYAAIAASSAHALHMPSHIFIRMGLWNESINSNLVATSAAKCYAENTGIKGHWDEELHSLDYLVYAYLQKAENMQAKELWDYLKTINEVHPVNFKVAYAFAAIPARYLLENKMWEEAASLKVHPATLAWEKFPWQKAIIHFTRLLGSVHTGHLDSARMELKNLRTIHDTLMNQKDLYKANQVQIQIKTSEAWILFKEGKNNEALKLMTVAAGMEDNTQKHPVTPGEVIPARELLGDMLFQMNKPDNALEAYEADLKQHANRFNGLYSAGLAAEKSNNVKKANYYYQQLIDIANSPKANRAELERARLFLRKQKTLAGIGK
ncbi:MAG: tetratricopeptide repeat protein [Chitinophagaceae bacterium]